MQQHPPQNLNNSPGIISQGALPLHGRELEGLQAALCSAASATHSALALGQATSNLTCLFPGLHHRR